MGYTIEQDAADHGGFAAVLQQLDGFHAHPGVILLAGSGEEQTLDILIVEPAGNDAPVSFIESNLNASGAVRLYGADARNQSVGGESGEIRGNGPARGKARGQETQGNQRYSAGGLAETDTGMPERLKSFAKQSPGIGCGAADGGRVLP